jgi:hypothetical protein
MTITRIPFAYWICLLGLTLFPACLEVETTSQINSDGSILRTITFDDDSTSIYRGNFPVPIDSTWQRTIQKVDEKKFRLTASRLFHNVDEMNDALKGTFGKTLQFRFSLNRSFQWFFTKYRFDETNLKYIQFDTIPMTEFLSKDEIEAWRLHEIEKKPFSAKGDSLALMSAGPRFEEWERRNVFEPVFAVFLNGVRKLNNPLLTITFVEQNKDSLYTHSAEFVKGKIDTLPFVFARVLKTPLARRVWETNSQEFKDIKEKITLDFGGSFVTNVMMPGLITGSNAQTIEGNKATWRDYKDYARVLGYTMWIESRQVNWWAVILTGVLVLALMVVLAISIVKRRRQV